MVTEPIYAQGEFISYGATGYLELLPDGRVLKSPLPGPDYDMNRKDIEFEAQVYQRLGRHDRLVQMLGFESHKGLCLEYIPGGNLQHYLMDHDQEDIPMSLKIRWASEAAEGLQFVHCHHIIHCDMKLRNLLLDAGLHLKLVDFSGSTWEGSRSYASEPTRCYLPRNCSEIPTRSTDLFALGSTIYEIFTGRAPYGELASDEVTRRYEAHIFPEDVNKLLCGDIIQRCWLGRFESAQLVYEALKTMEFE
jgi:serine/threonine protein kinase